MRYLYTILFVIVSYFSYAQNADDALRYSFIRHGGTSRYMAMGGAFGALGSDFSSLSTNPAGIATFKKTIKFMISPMFLVNSVTAKYRKNETNDNIFAGGLNNLGLVVSVNSGDEYSDWRNVCFGIGYNRFLDFNQNISIKGYSEESSMLDQFALNSNGSTPDDLFQNYQEVEWLAWAAELTDVMEGSKNNTYTHPYLFTAYLNQERKHNTNGGVGEFVFTLGGNYRNVLQIGASLGIQSVNYDSKASYTESSDSTDLQSYTFSENLLTTGTGFNFKFGLIYIPFNFLRLGAAIHSPTFYSLTDFYSYSMESNWRTPDDDGNTHYVSNTEEFNDNGTTENEFSYELFTPYRFVGSAALVISHFAILSADYEYVDYSLARLRSVEDNFSRQNTDIKNSYYFAENLRLGAEIRLAPLYFRAGMSYYGSPYSQDYEAKGSVKSQSFGIGLKTNRLYIDFAYQRSEYSKDYKLFDYIKFLDNGTTIDATEMSELSFDKTIMSVTVGYRF